MELERDFNRKVEGEKAGLYEKLSMEQKHREELVSSLKEDKRDVENKLVRIE